MDVSSMDFNGDPMDFSGDQWTLVEIWWILIGDVELMDFFNA